MGIYASGGHTIPAPMRVVEKCSSGCGCARACVCIYNLLRGVNKVKVR